jgi:hypothetical protein
MRAALAICAAVSGSPPAGMVAPFFPLTFWISRLSAPLARLDRGTADAAAQRQRTAGQRQAARGLRAAMADIASRRQDRMHLGRKVHRLRQ